MILMQFYKNFNLIHNTFDSFIYYLIFYLKIFFISCINKIKFFISLLSTKKTFNNCLFCENFPTKILCHYVFLTLLKKKNKKNKSENSCIDLR